MTYLSIRFLALSVKQELPIAGKMRKWYERAMPGTVSLGVSHADIRVLAAAVGQREAARQMGISENTVKSVCFRNGDSKKLKIAMVEKQESVLHPSAPSVLSVLEKTLLERRERTKLAQSAYLAKASEKLAEVDDSQLLEHAPIGKTLAEMASKVYPEVAVDHSTHLSFFSVAMERPGSAGSAEEGAAEIHDAIDLPPQDDY